MLMLHASFFPSAGITPYPGRVAMTKMKCTERREGGEVLGEDGKKPEARAKCAILEGVQSRLLAWHSLPGTMTWRFPRKFRSSEGQSLGPDSPNKVDWTLILNKRKAKSRKRGFIQRGHVRKRNKGVECHSALYPPHQSSGAGLHMMLTFT